MEEAMEEDNAIGDDEQEVQYFFTAYEVDIDYEFDAVRFFDFSRDESPLEALASESWFDSARTYPASPFVLKMAHGKGSLLDNVNVSPKPKGGVIDMCLMNNVLDGEETSHMDESDKANEGTVIMQENSCNQRFQNPSEVSYAGLCTHTQEVTDINGNNQFKLCMKSSFPRSSTFMKPTMSQLAKQNHRIRANNHCSSKISLIKKEDKSCAAVTFGIDNQAAKRQKLEGGLLRKVPNLMQMQQTNFVHKASKRDEIINETVPRAQRTTVPREPVLATAHRAQRTRQKSNPDAHNATSLFKARPLNRKIFEAPSFPKRSIPHLPRFQEFHLKTSERASQHVSTVMKTPDRCDKSENRKNISALTTGIGNKIPSRSDSCQPHSFKALPLNKKILASKGEMGVFHNIKKETTVPMEFNFQSERKSRVNPPIELLNKLSLGSEAQESATILKGHKENRWGWFQQGSEMKHLSMPKLAVGAGEHHHSLLGGENEHNHASGINWSKNIR